MNKVWQLGRAVRVSVLIAIGVFASLPMVAQSSYILTAAPSDVQTIAGRHGLTVVKELFDDSSGKYCVMLVTSPSVNVPAVETDVDSDLLVGSFELEQSAFLPELSGLTQASLTQSTSAILESLPSRNPVSYYGSMVPSNYSSQTATQTIRVSDARSVTNLTGAGTVAIIDTGVDTTHGALTNVLVPGYNFVSDSYDPSELQDLSATTGAALTQSTSAILEQSTSAILEGQGVVPLSPSTSAILDQSTSAILEGNAPKEFGHGTMVAGIVHLVAPTALIMPLKAFRADGTSNLSDIVRAIYYAADNGANIISMSFSIGQSSPALQTAVQYALKKNVAVVAASGNDGLKIQVFPASYGGVQGVGSTTSSDLRSSFSNYGSGVTLFAAPGEGVITTYPAGMYAAGWGTSFSTPMVAGAAALVLQAHPSSKPGDITNALSKAKQIHDMGYGRIDLCLALTELVGGTCPALKP